MPISTANNYTSSTVVLQQIVNIAKAYGDLAPILNVAGSSAQPALTIANDVMNAICGVAFPHKWNEINLPVFYTNSYQQDYAVLYPTGMSILNLAWLERGVVIDINNAAIPKPYRLVECGRQLPQATGTFSFNSYTQSPLFLVNFFPNMSLYYGTWGSENNGTSSFGNNPVAGSVYTNPLGTASMPVNPITQIQDANGNLLVLTTYGIEGTTAPVLGTNATPGSTCAGTGATTIWTVANPWGMGFRILPVPSETGVVWQFNLTGQMTPVRFTSLSQTLYPLPDYFEPNFRQGFIAQCYRYSPEQKIRQKFHDEWSMWLASLIELRAKQDRELEENMFVPDRGIMSGGSRNNTWYGPQWPFRYPSP